MPSLRLVDPVPWPPPTVPVDLEAVARALAPLRGTDTTPTAGRYRRLVQQVEHEPRRVYDVDPATPAGFVDGIQARALLGRVEHRDLTAVWVAAGTVLGGTLLDHHPRLAVVCSELDEEEVRGLAPAMPVVALPETTPWALAQATADWIDKTRRRMEEAAIEAAPEVSGQVISVDGSLPTETRRRDLVGVVKQTLETDWLPDPTLLPAEEGWRSPALLIPGSRTTERSKLTAYMRLHTASPRHAYGHALIRVEVYEDSPVTLDSAAAMAFALRGSPPYGDPRWTVQLRPMWLAEKVLKAQIPHVIRTLG